MKRCVKLVTFISLFHSLLLNINLYPIEINLREHNGISAAVRSFLLPGWGQYYNEQKQKAYIFFGTTIIPLCTGWYFYNDAEQTYKKYEEKGLKNDPLYEEYEKKFITANIFFVISMISWGYGIIDAYLHGENYKRKYGFEMKLHKDKTNFQFVYRF